LVLTRPDTLGFVVVATITDSAKKPRFPVLLKHSHHAAIYKDSTVMFEAVALLPGAVVAAAWKAQSKPLRALGETHLQRILDAVRECDETPNRVRITLGWKPPQDREFQRFERKKPRP